MSSDAAKHASNVSNPFVNFELEKVLSHSERNKFIALLGRWHDKPDKGIVLLSRRPFDATKVQAMLTTSPSSELEFQNDVYSKYSSTTAPEQSTITIDTIYPATAKHISKHSTQKFVMVAETPATYSNKVLPYIQSLPASGIAWVYNILEKKAETERLLFEDPDPVTGFMLHPDLKWDQTQTEGLYCIALCHSDWGSQVLVIRHYQQRLQLLESLVYDLTMIRRHIRNISFVAITLLGIIEPASTRRDIKSLRDLTTDCLPLLKNLKHQTCQVIKDKYGVGSDQLRAYIHYHPSYYHLHVHFMHLSVDAGAGMAAGKAHLLDEVIDNLEEFGSEHYRRRTLYFTIGENDPLYKHCFVVADPPQAKRQKH